MATVVASCFHLLWQPRQQEVWQRSIGLWMWKKSYLTYCLVQHDVSCLGGSSQQIVVGQYFISICCQEIESRVRSIRAAAEHHCIHCSHFLPAYSRSSLTPIRVGRPDAHKRQMNTFLFADDVYGSKGWLE